MQTEINPEDVNVLTATVAKIAPRYVHETWEEAVARVPELKPLGELLPTGEVLTRAFELADTKVGHELVQVFTDSSPSPVFMFREVGERPYLGQEIHAKEPMQANALEHPQITPAEIQANIASEYYFTGADGYCGAEVLHPDFAALAEGERCIEPPETLETLTFCVLVLKNGHRVVGINYGSTDPSKHSEQRGRDDARAKAVEQIWPLMKYELRSMLAQETAQ